MGGFSFFFFVVFLSSYPYSTVDGALTHSDTHSQFNGKQSPSMKFLLWAINFRCHLKAVAEFLYCCRRPTSLSLHTLLLLLLLLPLAPTFSIPVSTNWISLCVCACARARGREGGRGKLNQTDSKQAVPTLGEVLQRRACFQLTGCSKTAGPGLYWKVGGGGGVKTQIETKPLPESD